MKELTPEQKQKKAIYAKEWRARNPEKVKEHSRRTREKNKEKIHARQKEWREANKERHNAKSKLWYENNKERQKDGALRRLFNMSLDEYFSLLMNQDYRCAICRRDTPNRGEYFAVDHDRRCCPGATSCGRCIRGLLCSHCNVGLGHFRDDLDLLEKAMKYLDIFSQTKTNGESGNSTS